MIEKIGYILRETTFEDGLIVKRGEGVYMHIGDAQQEFNNRVEQVRGGYDEVTIHDNLCTGDYSNGMSELLLELIPTRIHGCPIGKDEVTKLIISKLSVGPLTTPRHIVLDFGKDENYEHCDKMVLVGVLHEYAVGRDENGKTQLKPVYYVYLNLIFKKGNYTLSHTHKENIECVDERILDKLYEYASNIF